METIREFIESTPAGIDGDVIKGVHILGFKSKNGRVYDKTAVKEAVKIYEGAHVYTDHADGARKVEDKFGQLSNVAYDPARGLVGDLKYLSSHPMASRVKEDVEKKMGLFGLSHTADVAGRKIDGTNTVFSIGAVKSVDLVCDPATTKSLKESTGDTCEFPPFPEATANAPPASSDLAGLKVWMTEQLDALKTAMEKKATVKEQTLPHRVAFDRFAKPVSGPAPTPAPQKSDLKEFLRS